MGFIHERTGVPRKVAGLLGVIIWIGGMWVMLEWILADTSEMFLYVGVLLVGLSGLVISAAVIDYQYEHGELDGDESNQS